jgi:hypothetical protein
MRRWARRSLMVVGLVALVAVAWLVLVAKNYSTPISSYRVVDDRTIVVQVTGGHLSWCRLTSTVETAADIRVSAECLDWLPGPGTALGVFYELTVRLSQPLNNRVVKDGVGVPVALR